MREEYAILHASPQLPTYGSSLLDQDSMRERGAERALGSLQIAKDGCRVLGARFFLDSRKLLLWNELGEIGEALEIGAFPGAGSLPS